MCNVFKKNSSTSMKMYENEQKKSAIGSIVPECVALLLQKKEEYLRKLEKKIRRALVCLNTMIVCDMPFLHVLMDCIFPSVRREQKRW